MGSSVNKNGIVNNPCTDCPLEKGCRIKGKVQFKDIIRNNTNIIREHPIIRRRSAYKHKPMDYIEGDRDAAVWIIGLNPKLNGKKPNGSKIFQINKDQVWDRDSKDLEKDLTAGIHNYFKSYERMSHKLWRKRYGFRKNSNILRVFLSPYLPNERYFKIRESYFKDLTNSKEGYIANFAHTDLVCCATTDFPPSFDNKDKNNFKKQYKLKKIPSNKFLQKRIVDHCKQFLIEKITFHQPKLIIGAGVPTCIELVKSFPNEKDKENIMIGGKFKSYDDIQDYCRTMTQTELVINNFRIPIIFSPHLGRSSYWPDRRLGREIEATLSEIEFQEFRKSL